MINLKKLIRLVLLSCASLIFSCKNQTKPEFSEETFQLTDQSWGYKIYKNEISFIVQSNIPAISNEKGFQTKSDASKVGQLVVQKLNQKKMPTITINELDSLKIHY